MRRRPAPRPFDPRRLWSSLAGRPCRRCVPSMVLMVCMALMAVTLGCAAPSPVVGPAPLTADPVVAHAGPGDTELRIELHNPAPMPRRLSNWRIEGRDWLGFQIVDATLPKLVASDATVTLHVRVDAAAFERTDGHDHARPGAGPDDGAHGYARYGPGRAALAVDVDGHTQQVPLAFAPGPDPRLTLRASLAALLVLVGLGIAAASMGETPRGGLSVITHDRGRGASTGLAVLGLLAALYGLATLPVALPLCAGPPGAAVGPLEHLRCAEGLGGAPVRLSGASSPAGLLGPVVALLLALACASAGAPAPRRVVAHAMPRVIVLVALTVAVAFAQRTTSLDALAWPASLRDPGADPWEAWAALRHPVAAVLVVWAAATLFERWPDRPTQPPGRFWIDLLVAALIAAVWFGGGAIPGGTLARLGMFGFGVSPGRVAATLSSAVGFVVVAASVYAVAQGLRRHARAVQLPPGAWVLVALACAAWIAVTG